MKIDQNKLRNVTQKSDGKITAQCPACAAGGGDEKGEHLAVYRDGKFGCVLYEKDKAHNRAILKLVGTGDRGEGSASCRLSISPVRVEESRVLMKIGRLGRIKSAPCQPVEASPCGVTEHRPPGPDVESLSSGGWCVSDNITDPELREFLSTPVS